MSQSSGKEWVNLTSRYETAMKAPVWCGVSVHDLEQTWLRHLWASDNNVKLKYLRDNIQRILFLSTLKIRLCFHWKAQGKQCDSMVQMNQRLLQFEHGLWWLYIQSSRWDSNPEPFCYEADAAPPAMCWRSSSPLFWSHTPDAAIHPTRLAEKTPERLRHFRLQPVSMKPAGPLSRNAESLRTCSL